MRKITLIILMIFSAVILVACSDKQLSDNLTNVLFYTGRNATLVETYFDVSIGSTIEEPEAPERVGYHFEGWFKDVTLLQKWDFNNDVVTETILLYAKWKALVWTLDFVLNEELDEVFATNDTPPSSFNAGQSIALPDVRRPGGSFRGWAFVPQEEFTSDMKVYKNTIDLPVTLEEGFILFPIFNNNKYLVTYQVRNSEVSTPAPKTGVEYGSIISWLPILADTSTQRFVGWFTKNGNNGDWGVQLVNRSYDVNGDPIELPENVLDYFPNPNNTLLYAMWEDK